MSVKLNAACKTDVGREREQNEDNVYAVIAENSETGLFIVADGMGGYQAGEVASRIAVEKIRDVLKTIFVPVYDQPTVRLSPISEQETMRLNQVSPDEQATIRIDQSRPDSKARTRRLSESPIAKNVEDQ